VGSPGGGDGVKVLLLSNLFPTSRDRNRGLFTAQLASEMARLCDLRVAVPLPWTPSGTIASRILPARYREFALLDASCCINGVEAEYPRYAMLPKISERWHARLMYAGLRGYLTRMRRTFSFQVINAHWLYPDGVAAVRLGRMLGVPVVLTGLGCDINEFLFAKDKRSQIIQALHDADAITVVSQELATVLTTQGVSSDRIATIANGVDTSRFAPAPRGLARHKLGLNEHQPLVVCVSRLSPEKGVHVLVEAGSLLARHKPGVSIVVVGEGPDKTALTERIKTLGLDASLRLIGAVPHAAVATWLAAADVVCMPSMREGHPNAAMEALACGRPLVASRVGALRSMIGDHAGVLVEPGDPSALASALTAALEHGWDAARIASSVANDSWAAAATGYVDVLRTVVAKTRRQ
jgi:teichuronic acid biosynthesis glycosyltransferase TuaC